MDKMDKLRENKPTADVLMTSMRAMGYSFESAVADIIDNSISAHASKIADKVQSFFICVLLNIKLIFTI